MQRLQIIALAAAMIVVAGCASEHANGPLTGIAQVNGGKVEYVDSGPKDGEPVLFIHGGGLADSFALVAKEPALDDYRLIRMHRRGYAGSSDPDLPRSITANAADAVGLLDALRIHRAHIVGHSEGGALALQMAFDAPERVASLTVIDPVPPSGFTPAPPPPADGSRPANPLEQAQTEGKRRMAAGDAEGALEPFYSFVFGEDWRDYFTAIPGGWEQAVADAPIDIGTDYLPWKFGPEEVGAIKPPVLVLTGDQSPLYQGPVLTKLVAAFPNAENAVIENTDHALIVQDPKAVAEAIADFLKRHPM